MKPSVLFILHLPNPVHGASMVGKFIKESLLINKEFSSEFINLSTSNKLTEVNKLGLAKIFRITKIQFQVIKSLLGKNHDLCYITLSASGVGFYKDLLIVILLKLFNKRVIYHFHNKGVSSAQDGFVNNLLYNYTFRNSKSILLSKLLYKDIQQYVKEEDVYYCPNGILEIQDANQPRKNLSNNPVCKLLYLSNMMAEKGALVLLEALYILNTKNISFECHFVGAWYDITEASFNDKIIEYRLQEKVFAHGPKFADEKNSFFKNSDIFVFPTYYQKETFGLVNLEAMQYCLPIISTNEGGIPDVVIDGETGFIVSQRNATELADKIEVLIKNPELRVQMGKAGKERFHRFFTLNVFENNLISILKHATLSNFSTAVN